MLYYVAMGRNFDIIYREKINTYFGNDKSIRNYIIIV